MLQDSGDDLEVLVLKEVHGDPPHPALAQSLALGGNPPLPIRLASSLLASHQVSFTAGIMEATLVPLPAAPWGFLSQLVQTKAGRGPHWGGGGAVVVEGLESHRCLDFLSNGWATIVQTGSLARAGVHLANCCLSTCLAAL